MAGYSSTPLNKKLGIKPGMRLFVKQAPAEYEDMIAPLPEGLIALKRLAKDLDFVHLFSRSAAELERLIKQALPYLERNGMIWASWPKKASRVKTDITEDTIRAIALPLGLVDVKVCAIDDTWSGLKLVIRKENR